MKLRKPSIFVVNWVSFYLFLFHEHLWYCYMYFHCSYLYNYYDYSQTLCIKCTTLCIEPCTFSTWKQNPNEGILLHLSLSIFFIFFPWASFHPSIFTQVRIDDQVFSHWEIIQSDDTLNGLYKDTHVIFEGIFDTCPTFVDTISLGKKNGHK